MNEISYCLQCYEKVSEYGELCSDILDTICRFAEKEKLYIYCFPYCKPHIRTIIEMLERKGYIISTEVSWPSIIAVKPANYDSKRETYCWCAKKYV